ncbi:MAG: bacillithiol biosynthesis cysteine-adding enzyme BshC [Candidatus Kapaibacteriota bacterium]
MKIIDFQSVPGFSKLFVDFLKKESFFVERFVYTEDLFNNEKIIEKKLKNYNQRNHLLKIVEKSNSDLTLTSSQKRNIELLAKDNTAIVVTGQQPGAFGGPLYVFYKTLTAIKLVEKLSKRHPQYYFVPLFWIEDNDHDYLEAFQSLLLNRKCDVVNLPLDAKLHKEWRNSISELRLSKDFANFVEHYINLNYLEKFDPDFSNFLIELYTKENSLVEIFQQILHYLFGTYGLIFILASECRQANAFKDILFSEFEKFGSTYSIIETANRLIETQGYHIQAKNSLPNLFYHTTAERRKVEWDDKNKTFRVGDEIVPDNEIINFFEQNSTKFSPNVLLRPICQDYVLPNIASVLGPSEIGYTTQLKELYEWFKIPMPAIVARHSITFTLKDYEKLIDKFGFNYFLRSRKEIEDEIYDTYKDLNLRKTLDKFEKEFENIFENLKQIGSKLDNSLRVSAEAHFSKSYRHFNAYINKIFQAERRTILNKNKEIIDHTNLLFPNGTLQERALSFVFPLLFINHHKFIGEIEKIISLPPTHHYLLII